MTNQILWEERNLIEPPMNCEIKEEQETSDITKSTKTSLMPSDWRSIIDPKLRKKARIKAYYKANKDKFKAYHQENKDKIKAYKKAYHKIYNIANREKKKAYDLVNEDKIKAYKKIYDLAYQRNRTKTDARYKLSRRLRSRLRRALQGNYKNGSAVTDLGCSISELKTHLESKFQPGMTWDNWSFEGWHIDHIVPLASFDLTDRNQLLTACNYTNLQPLWAIDNLIKGAK
jgi:hypothetical protein